MAATTPRSRMNGEANQSRSAPLSSMICSAPTQTISRPRPTKSPGRRWVDSLSGRVRRATTTSSTATGTLMKNTHDQPKASEMVPPSTGPRTGAIRVVTAHRPMVWGRRRGGTRRCSRVWDIGIIGPPDRPCRTRNTTSQPSDGAMPHRNEHRPNRPMQVTNTRAAPKRPASQPVRGTVMASATA